MNKRPEAFWNQMFTAGKMGDKKQFSLCFSRQPTSDRNGTEAGAMTLGGVEPRLHLTEMVYTTNAGGGKPGFYSVKVRNIYVRVGSAGESAKSLKADPKEGVERLNVPYESLNHGGVILDSGTTDTYWNRAIATAFRAVFQRLSGQEFSNSPMTLTDEQLKSLPTILFQFETDPDANAGNPYTTVGLAGWLDPEHPKDVILAFPPSHYMEYDAEGNTYTAQFYPSKGGGSVLGANAMMGHDVLFDVEHDRLGFAESKCDYTHLLTDNGYQSTLDVNFRVGAALVSASDGNPPPPPPTSPAPTNPPPTSPAPTNPPPPPTSPPPTNPPPTNPPPTNPPPTSPPVTSAATETTTTTLGDSPYDLLTTSKRAANESGQVTVASNAVTSTSSSASWTPVQAGMEQTLRDSMREKSLRLGIGMEDCDTLECQGILGIILLVTLSISFYLTRCCYRIRSRRQMQGSMSTGMMYDTMDQGYRDNPSVLEMTMRNDFRSYRDKNPDRNLTSKFKGSHSRRPKPARRFS